MEMPRLETPRLILRGFEMSDLDDFAASYADPDVMRTLTAHHARELDQGDGVLILADLYGATPCNIGLSLSALGVHLRCVSGLNLPMLLRVLNYAEKPLDELAEIAASGGRGGIFIDHA